MAEGRTDMEFTEFERLVKDALADLFDYAALQAHPLAGRLAGATGDKHSRADRLRDALIDAIERLRPPEAQVHLGSSEWRPHLILRERYVEGRGLQEIQRLLALSERQLRREHGRAVAAVATLLWDEFFPGQVMTEADAFVALVRAAPDADIAAESTFAVSSEPLDVLDLLRGVMSTLQRRAESEGTFLELIPDELAPRAFADRVILRQILVGLISYALETRVDGPIQFSTETLPGRVGVRIRFAVDEVTRVTADDKDRVLSNVTYWARRIQAQLDSDAVDAEPGAMQLVLTLPRADEPLLLIVDDQEAALRMYQRYLSQTGVRLIGVSDSRLVMEYARRLQPQAIVLDVMMPNVDGWEVLQSLQADPVTHHIPVIICSVWEEPDLAFSLGATGFLKKPITQEQFLKPLAELRLLGNRAESPPSDR